MKTLYEKNELTFAIVWIVVYCVLQSLANPLNARLGWQKRAGNRCSRRFLIRNSKSCWKSTVF